MDRTQTNGNPGHGTHCSGIIGATGLIENGTVGISPEVSIMPLRFIGPDGSGDLNSAIKAIDYAISKKVRVISSSWGAAVDRSSAQPLVDAVKRADDAGIAFVVAAANDGKSNDETEVYPANAGFGNTISVAASDDQDAKPKWSNYGQRTVHVASPGLNIMSTLPNNRYGNLSGTSMATPLVAGLTAFLLAQDPSLTGAQVRALLQHTGAKVDIETACHCRIDAMTAVDTLLNKKMFIVPAAATLGPQGSVRFSTKNAKGNVTYTVANAAVGTIAADGAFTAKSAGDTTVTATDASGAQSTTLRITVGALGEQDPPAGGSAPQPPGDGGGQPPLPQPPGGGGGGGGGACPIGDAAQCQALCQIMPDLPFCSHH
jgi:thermitase